MRELVDAFYRDRSIVNHQLASFNDFLDRRLQKIVDTTVIGLEEEGMHKGYIYITRPFNKVVRNNGEHKVREALNNIGRTIENIESN